VIRQPNVILGNDKLLVTMGRKGEILGFFIPAETTLSMSRIRSLYPYRRKALWTNDNEWHSIQNI